MEKKINKKYSEEFLKRFDELYSVTSTKALDKLLRKEFPSLAKNKTSNAWTALAYRRGLKKEQNMEQAELISVSANPATPDVEIPTTITFGKHAYPIALLKLISDKMHDGVGLAKAYEAAAKEMNIVADKQHIISLTNFFRWRFNTKIAEFEDIPKGKVDTILQREQRTELVRMLKKEKWRNVAIVEKTADLFPDLDPLSTEEIEKIKNFWRAGKREKIKKRALEPEDQNPVVRTIAKNEDAYVFSIVGPLLHYRETVPLVKAKAILKAVLMEETK